MIDLCAKLGVRHYIERDLQPYLPEGYPNPSRVAQHHGAEYARESLERAVYM